MTEIEDDFQKLGRLLVILYLQSINGVVCDPLSDTCCKLCKRTWAEVTEILNKYDSEWGNMYRTGELFQP